MSAQTQPAGHAAETAEALAQHLASPAPVQADEGWLAQSLAEGAAGVALLHIERALTGTGTWRTAHAWATAATAAEVSAADVAGLYLGIPAISFTLHAAQADGNPRYAPALGGLDVHVSTLTHRRVDLALARIGRGEFPVFAEYDIFRGLTGIGAHLLEHAPADDALGRVLAYLVRLTRPRRVNGADLPGWWVGHDPSRGQSAAFPGGHANLGIAHGITGPLALLSQALRRGVTVDGQADAIEHICAWLDTWRQDADAGCWWPQWLTYEDLRTGQSGQRGPLRPSWCYGTPGLARAQQLAALATGDARRRRIAEQALADCVGDPIQLARITDPGLCHGWAGLYQTAWRTARDALTPTLGPLLPDLARRLREHGHPGQGAGIGLLQGRAGLALALTTAAHNAPPASAWDACLLIT
ncbi:lanthionine synthetase C family protein [Streptomyces sp. NBC_01803]|uniref:lanthionine synthetase C family protein n=1 Tax=Streptomyces sp. NBC_01803 TaxID=2975946 RepID=UPI002DD82D12|nr:lanthionine synthetase C family protein [Streptomyces sp. NBC_01803]WSA44199.1 lanthionine synthetase C family protein [Streptomyces sp. NBC_01803]